MFAREPKSHLRNEQSGALAVAGADLAGCLATAKPTIIR